MALTKLTSGLIDTGTTAGKIVVLDGSAKLPAVDASNVTGLTASQIPSLDTAKITTGTLATARLGSGTANSTSYLRGDQTWSVPAAGAMTFVSSATCSGTSSITLNIQFQAGYNYLFYLDGLATNSGGAEYLAMQFGTGATPTIQTTNYISSTAYGNTSNGDNIMGQSSSTAASMGGDNTSRVQMGNVAVNAGYALNGEILVMNPSGSATPSVWWRLLGFNAGNSGICSSGAVARTGGGAITAIKLFVTSGSNFVSGTISCFKIQKS